MKTLKCRDGGFDCADVVNAETVEEVLAITRRRGRGEWTMPIIHAHL